MTHPIIADLNNRYTTKKYDETKKVSKEDLSILLEALRLTASSINSQPWKFIVIESDEGKQRFFDTFKNNFQFNQDHAKTASHIILFANKETYSQADYDAVIEKNIEDGHISPEKKETAFGAYAFAELNKDAQGKHVKWTRAQTYIALGNAYHTLARLNIDSTAMEGIDKALVKEIFAKELEGYECNVALAIGYHHEEDRNAQAPKSRLALEDIITFA